MKKQHSWKRRQIGSPEIRSALQSSTGNITRAAAQLGLSRETLSRWLRGDPSLRGSAPAPTRGEKKITTKSSFASWVRRTYDLAPAEKEILRLAELALAMARNTRASDTARLSAMREFRAAIKHLDLPEVLSHGEIEEEAAATVRAFPRRVG